MLPIGLNVYIKEGTTDAPTARANRVLRYRYPQAISFMMR